MSKLLSELSAGGVFGEVVWAGTPSPTIGGVGSEGRGLAPPLPKQP